ncbi:Serine beta-lactamase-like protein [Fulvivirga imtechensis AK7]|uniref:Serine beta-lactamase-like protein n=1 Tax=Fulvivirga imtechensis AK7 TaxID=1237149 RepID=L8JYW3_9BACT|nr:serine hydrolase domain-containing protein [Fulvivirga imtechensis]ELR72824.1 Serine beta-lactamase-like protein [Fulvivirga imtechensis AK7]
MKKLLLWGMIPMIIMLVYFFFEPIFTYNVGWQPLPNEVTDAESHVMDSAFVSAVDGANKMLAEARKELQAPAISVAVGIGNKLVWARAKGYKDIDKQDPADIKTVFRIGSVSKAITSVALGKLLEQQKLQLDKPVQYYASYVSMETPITIRQLASHTSGIRNYGLCLCFPAFEYYNNKEYESIEESVDVFQHDDLLFEPGSRYSYSSYNYTLLSAALEEAAGIPFLNYVDREIFTPIGMKHTAADHVSMQIDERATFYDVEKGQYKVAFPVNNSNKWAGGGFVSSPSDLVRLGNALLNDEILKKSTIDILFTPQKLNDGSINEEGYALGWRVEPEHSLFDGKKLTPVAHHGGVAMGSTAFLVLFPEYNMVVALAMNRNKPPEYSSFSKYAFSIAEAFLRESD